MVVRMLAMFQLQHKIMADKHFGVHLLRSHLALFTHALTFLEDVLHAHGKRLADGAARRVVLRLQFEKLRLHILDGLHLVLKALVQRADVFVALRDPLLQFLFLRILQMQNLQQSDEKIRQYHFL